MEIWGGGGVPADDGPPLGLSWNLQSTRHVNIDEFEDERELSRTPKDSYCVEVCARAAHVATTEPHATHAPRAPTATTHAERAHWRHGGRPVQGCVEPYVRRQMLLGSGSTHKQIKAYRG